jgi:alpha-beta hydrolase superfamily lysophospholipase
MRRVGKIFGILIAVLIVTGSMLYFIQEKLIFLPTKLPADFEYSFQYPFDEIFLTAEDGAVLNALHFKNENPAGVILYFHGNAGDLSRWGQIATYFVEKNYDVVIMDYRTYGKSTGILSEEALMKDAQLFYDYAVAIYKEDQLILYGRSLGTGLASFLASRNHPSQLILETPYFSMLDVAKERFPYLPLSFMIKYKMPSYEFLQTSKCPILIVHGTKDKIVPLRSGEKLYNVLKKKEVTMVVVEGGEHNNLLEFNAYREAIKRTLQPVYSNRSEDK